MHWSFTDRVQFELNPTTNLRPDQEPGLGVVTEAIPILVKRNLRARRYVLRVNQQGRAQVTIPRGGSAAEAQRFMERNRGWLEQQLQRLATKPKRTSEWLMGSEILFRGRLTKIEPAKDGQADEVRLGTEIVRLAEVSGDLRPHLEQHLRILAAKELPAKVWDFAALHQVPVQRVCVRNQKSRWGSCSRSGTISLNWRLIQTPESVRDYIILHELMHLREMNHSSRFWSEVDRVCPNYQSAELWLKKNTPVLL